MGDQELELHTTDKINAVLALLPLNNDNAAAVLELIKVLRNSCARGPNIQKLVVSNNQFCDFMQATLFQSTDVALPILNYERIQLLLWQLLANSIVNNRDTQQLIGSNYGTLICHSCVKPPLGKRTDIQLMILFNIFKGGTDAVTDLSVLQCITRLWQRLIDEKCAENLEFLHFFFEHFLVDNRSTVRCYAQLETTERIAFLDYISNYLRKDSPNGTIGAFLMVYLSKEFKMKSDCIMRQSTKDVESVQPREAYGLLRVIAAATGSAQYSQIYKTDHALFLNVSSLLRCLVAVGKEAKKTIFTPMNKLDEVALASKMSADFEKEVSFELKTMLVRCVANLLHENKVNKGYCLDTQLIPALLECTNMDARNPLIKEWSILAIRNACMDCPEIQAIIANLTNQGMVQNDIVNELQLDMGSLRIQSSK